MNARDAPNQLAGTTILGFAGSALLTAGPVTLWMPPPPLPICANAAPPMDAIGFPVLSVPSRVVPGLGRGGTPNGISTNPCFGIAYLDQLFPNRATPATPRPALGAKVTVKLRIEKCPVGCTIWLVASTTAAIAVGAAKNGVMSGQCPACCGWPASGAPAVAKSLDPWMVHVPCGLLAVSLRITKTTTFGPKVSLTRPVVAVVAA